MGSAACASLRGVSLGLLLQQGLPAWCKAVQTASGPATRVSPPSAQSVEATITGDSLETSRTPFDGVRTNLIASNQRGDIVTLLAGLVLSTRHPHGEPAFSRGVSI